MNERDIKDDMQEIQENLETIMGTINDPAAAEAVKGMIESLSGMMDKMVTSQTTPQTILSKLKSRKFWMALLGAVAGICGMLSSDGNITAILIFVVLEIASIFGYFFTEGTIDSTRTKELMQMATQIAAIIGTMTPILAGGSDVELDEAEPADIGSDDPSILLCSNESEPDKNSVCYNGTDATTEELTESYEIPSTPNGDE